MRRYTFSEVSRLPGEVLDAAMREPVSLTKHGKPKVVMLPAEQYDRLMGVSDTRAFILEKAPNDVVEDMLSGIAAYRDAGRKDV